MENIVISKLVKENVKEAAALINALYNNMVKKRQDIFIPKDEDFEKYLDTRLMNDDFVILEAMLDGKFVGACEAEIKHLGDNEETKVRDILFIDYIAVDEKHRRNGVGRALMDSIKQIAKKRNVKYVELNVWGFNESAIKFYEACGMTKKRIVYEYFVSKE